MLVIWQDWRGEYYGFCSHECQAHYESWAKDPNYPFEKATFTEHSFGCTWCGGNLKDEDTRIITNE